MRFALTDEQTGFARSLDDLLSKADTPGVVRAWAAGQHESGLALWRKLAGLGVTMLAREATPVEVVVAFEALGRHAVPGPWVESAVYLPIALNADLSEEVATVAVAPMPAASPATYALDADVADRVYVDTGAGLAPARATDERAESIDPARRLFRVEPDGGTTDPVRLESAFDLAVLATAAQLLGLGERMLEDSVAYVKQRRQFGREIGSYQAVKHALADVRIGLDFARPVVLGAALEEVPNAAAKVAAGQAAYAAARTALQVHGAIGYTRELDLSLWILRTRALVSAWGPTAWHRARLLDALTGATP